MRGWLVLLLATAFLAATTAEQAHRAEVLHAVCGEHGELIHLEVSPATLAAATCAAPSGEPSIAQPLERDATAHEHCRLGPLQREPFLQPLVASSLVRPAPPAARAALAKPSIDPPRAEPLLLLAPKQSPPV